MAVSIEKRDDRKKLGDADQVMVRVGELEEELAHLKATYEQYFLGVERRPPTDAHEKFKKALKELRSTFVRQTGANFRVQALQAKYLTYERLWTRTLQEIEAGTYKRDLFKARRHQQKAEAKKKKPANGAEIPNPDATPPEDDPLGAHPEDAPGPPPMAAGERPPPPPPMAAMEDDDDEFGLGALTDKPPLPTGVQPLKPAGPISKTGLPAVAPVSKPGLPAVAPVGKSGLPSLTAAQAAPVSKAALQGGPAARPPSGAQKPVAPATEGSDLSEKKIKAIYDAYVMAKKRCNEDTSKLSVDTLATTLRKQVPELMKQHGAKSVEFKVVIKDGKAILRALPKT